MSPRCSAPYTVHFGSVGVSALTSMPHPLGHYYWTSFELSTTVYGGTTKTCEHSNVLRVRTAVCHGEAFVSTGIYV